jgi:hypothetical protein
MAFTLTVSPVVDINGVAASNVSLSLVGCTAGNAIIGGTYWSHASSTITSVTATSESNAALVGSPARAAGSNGDASVQLFYFQNLANSGTKTITANYSAEYGGVSLFAFEVAGGHLTALPDTNAGWHAEGAGTGDTPSVALATNQDNDLIVAIVAGGTGADPTQGAGFTLIPITQFLVRNAGEYDLDAGAAGTPSVGFTLGASDDYAIAAAAFRLASGAGSVTRTPSVGALALAGLAATVAVSGGVTRTPSVGALTLTGLQPVQELTVAAPITGSLALTGNAATVLRGTVRQPTVGSLTLAGQQATVVLPRTIAPSLGSLTLTGLQASVTVGVNNTILIPQVGSMTFNGQPVTLIQSSPLVRPATGMLTLTGNLPAVLNSTSSGAAYGGFYPFLTFRIGF